MKTLKEWNEERLIIWEEWNEERLIIWEEARTPGSKKNGIACPKCGDELLDSNSNIVITLIPPRKDVYCSCGFHGYRIA